MAEDDVQTPAQQKESLVARLDSEGVALLESIGKKLGLHGATACPPEVWGDVTPTNPSEGVSRARLIRAGVRLLNAEMDRRLLEQQQQRPMPSEEGKLSADEIRRAIMLAKNLLCPQLRTRLRFAEEPRWLLVAITESSFGSPKIPADPDGARQDAIDRLEAILDEVAHFAPGIREHDESGLIFVRDDFLVLLALFARSISSTAKLSWESKRMVGSVNVAAMTDFELHQVIDAIGSTSQSDAHMKDIVLSKMFSDIDFVLKSITDRIASRTDELRNRSRMQQEVVRGQSGLFEIDALCRKVLDNVARNTAPTTKASSPLESKPRDLLQPPPTKIQPAVHPPQDLQPCPARGPWPGGVAAYGAPSIPGIDWSSPPSTSTLPALRHVPDAGSDTSDPEGK
jgi:hypothetical protein